MVPEGVKKTPQGQKSVKNWKNVSKIYIYIYYCANKGYTKCQKTSLQSKKGPKILRKKKEKKTFQKSAEMSQKSATKVFFLNISKKNFRTCPQKC